MNHTQAEIARDLTSEYEHDSSQAWDDRIKDDVLKHDIDHMNAWKRKRDAQKRLRIVENRKPISSYFDDEWPNLNGAA